MKYKIYKRRSLSTEMDNKIYWEMSQDLSRTMGLVVRNQLTNRKLYEHLNQRLFWEIFNQVEGQKCQKIAKHLLNKYPV